MTISTLDYLMSSPALSRDFNKIREEVIREVGENQNEVNRRLTERILPDFIIRVHMEKNRENYLEKPLKKKREQYLEKKRKKYLEKPLEKKREKYLEKKLEQYLERKRKRYLKKALEKKKKRGLKKQFDSENINKNQEKEEEDSCKPKKQRKSPLEKEKSVVLRIIPPKKPLNQNQEIEEEEEGNSRKPKRQRKNPIEIKQMPTKFEDKIKGMQSSDIKLVIQKKLTPSDLDTDKNRLTIPSGQMKYEFLRKKERLRIKKKEADGIHFKGMEVALIEPGLQESTIFLKKWKVGNTNPYVLSNPWIKVAERNKLESSDTIQLWSFRVDQSLHLALIKLDN